MKKISFASACITLLMATSPLLAQTDAVLDADTLDEFSIGGSIDTYFHKSFGGKQNAPSTSFANLQGFSLGMINLTSSYTSSRSGFVADIVIGPRGSDAIFNARYTNLQGSGSSHLINQMFAYYRLSDKVRVNLGQFNTFLGYETITPVRNFHYSTSYLFTYGPFNHTGLWTEMNLSSAWSARLAIMNPTDFTEFNPFDSYTIGGQLGFTSARGSFYLSATYGDPDGKLQPLDSIGSRSFGNALQVDFTASTMVSEKYTLGIGTSIRATADGEVKTSNGSEISQQTSHAYFGAALYNQYAINEFLKLGLRTEYFFESNGGVGAIGQYDNRGNAWIYEVTLSANVEIGQFKLIPEIRVDGASSRIYSKTSDSISDNSLTTANLAVVYTLPRISRAISKNKF